MLFNIGSYPVLGKIKTKALGSIDLYSIDAEIVSNANDFGLAWARTSLGINNQIYYLSPEFVAAYEMTGDDLFNAFPYPQVEDDNICFLHADEMATCLTIRQYPEQKKITCSVFCFHVETITTVGNYEIDYADDSNVIRCFTGWQSLNISNVEATLFNCILMTLFVRYPEVRMAKIQPANTLGEYLNQSPMPIVVLTVLP